MKRIALSFLVLAIILLSSISTLQSQILIKDINPGPSGSSIEPGSKVVGGKLFFIARNSSSELWVSDRETDSTFIIGPVLPGVDGTPNSDSHFLVFRDSLLVFTAYLNSKDVTLYTTTGSLDGTQFIKTLTQGNTLDGFIEFNNKFYFQGYDAQHGKELWESDGSASGTHHLLNGGGKPC